MFLFYGVKEILWSPGMYDFIHQKLIEYSCFASVVKAHNNDLVLLVHEHPNQLGEKQTHLLFFGRFLNSFKFLFFFNLKKKNNLLQRKKLLKEKEDLPNFPVEQKETYSVRKISLSTKVHSTVFQIFWFSRYCFKNDD